MKHTRTAAVIAALSGALLALATTPASAAPPEIDHWTFSDSHIEQVEHEEEDWCEDEAGNDLIPFAVLFTENSHGNFRGMVRNGDFYGQSTVHVEQTWMNVENGKTLTSVWQGLDQDHKVVAQDDGTLYLTLHFTGPTKYYGPEGDRLFMDVGRTFTTIHLDADGNFMGVVDSDSKGRFETMNRDFCADILELLG
ncbi:hypothetical protein ABZ477_07760 [Microbacterium sp. NPDC019599]|uniref:hypothetical protein n=1 Tax=Microbacterium sp. NPDC019599 TaxID=3154690 RepID=UPI0033DC9C6F